MKKRIKFFTVIAIVALQFSIVNAQKNRTLSNGFSIKVIFGFPSNSYGTDHPVESEDSYNLLGGLKIGNQWYFGHSEKMKAGLMVNWFDFTMTGKKNSAALELAMEIGPIGTYAISDEMAIDVYYNIRPTVINQFISTHNRYGDFSNQYSGTGLTNAIGAGFRWKVLSGGLEYVFGSVKDKGFSGESRTIIMKANSFRVIIGVKF